MPTPIPLTCYTLAQRYVGIHELATHGRDHPLIQWWLSLCGFALDTPDETAWCSAFVNGIAWELRLPRSKSAAARSWLQVGTPIALQQADAGHDVVIFKRGDGNQPGPEVLAAPGHVAFFGGLDLPNTRVLALGGNQADGVTLAHFPIAQILGIRRLT